MTYGFDGHNYNVRLERGEHLVACLEQLFVATQLTGGWITGLGAASTVELGFYNSNSHSYKWRTFGRTMEVVSLSGNVAQDDKRRIAVHAHGVFADDEYQTVGGHVKDLTVAATLEICIRPTRVPLRRRLDQDVGLKLLDLGGDA